jgi:hypothetical protein
VSRWAPLALALALVASGACQRLGERETVVAGAFAVEARGPDDEPVLGEWGDELRPGRKLLRVSPDLVARGLGQGALVYIEGFPARYEVADLGSGAKRIEIFMGSDVAAAERWGERELEIYWRGAQGGVRDAEP